MTLKNLRLSAVLIIMCGLLVSTNSFAQKDLLAKYPSWVEFEDDKDMMEALRNIEKVVQKFEGEGRVAVFDWDGTLYHEKIKVKQPSELKYIPEDTELYYDYTKGSRSPNIHEAGQPVWQIWAASHASNGTSNYRDLNLVSLRMNDLLSPADNFDDIVDFTNRLEGEMHYSKGELVKMNEYVKFAQISIFEASMRPKDMHEAVKGFLLDYPPCDYAFFPALDIFHRLVEAGFKVWIVTGSNPYYVKPVIKAIEKQCRRPDDSTYDFGYNDAVYNPDTDRMYGNFAIISDGKFGVLLDDNRLDDYRVDFDPKANRFLDHKNPADAKRLAEIRQKDGRFINNKFGKTVAVGGYIEQEREKAKVAVLMGNSGSDGAMMTYVLNNHKDAIGIGINGMKDILSQEKYKGRTFMFDLQCNKEKEEKHE